MCRWTWIIVVGLLSSSSVIAQQQPGLFPAVAVKPLNEQTKTRDVNKLSPLQRHLSLSGYRGMDWLQRANQPDGKFLPGVLPALASKVESDPFLPQLEATYALIRAGRTFSDERALTLGKQALLRMLQETTTDPAKPTLRFTSAPEPFVNRVAAGGWLLRAIAEVPNFPTDLDAQGRQIEEYLISQILADGSFALTGNEDPGLKLHQIRTCTGPALAGLMRMAAPRKTSESSVAILKRALPIYMAAWRQDKTPAMIADHSAAYAAAFIASGGRETSFAQAVFEMNDWLLTQQFGHDPRRPLWTGGFMPWQDGKVNNGAPDASSAALACGLVEACRVAKHLGDAQRLARYRQSLEASLQFVTTLQFTDARVQHFAENYRSWIVGGIFTSHQDGNIRLSHTAHAVAALAGYMEFVVDLPE